MRETKPAIPIEVLRKVKFKPVAKRWEDTPVYADGNAILKKIEPKLKNPDKKLSKDDKDWWDRYYEDYEEAKAEAVKKKEFCNFKSYITEVFFRNLRKLDVQDMARINHSSGISMGQKYNDLMEKLRPLWVFKKIELSSWHWGKYKSATYNECAEADNCLASFELGIKDFTVAVDVSSGYNNMGYSRYTRTYLDTELAYIISYKGKHVLTIGFNIILGGDKTVQIRQIQCKNKKGNRWMYNMPKCYIDHIVDKFFEAFSGYDIHFITSSTATNDIAQAYINNVNKELKWLNEYIAEGNIDSANRRERYLNSALNDLFQFDSVDAPRMKSIYSKRIPGYKRMGKDDKGQCNVLVRA